MGLSALHPHIRRFCPKLRDQIDDPDLLLSLSIFKKRLDEEPSHWGLYSEDGGETYYFSHVHL